MLERAAQSKHNLSTCQAHAKHTPKFLLRFSGRVELVLAGFAYHLVVHVALVHVTAPSRR